jgi:LemA protein
MKKAISVFVTVWAIVVAVIAGGISLGVSQYNQIVRLRTAVDSERAQVATVLQRRLDLIPNLVETVKGYAAHERATLEAVTKARSDVEQRLKMFAGSSAGEEKAAMTELLAAQSRLVGSVNEIKVLAERYPDLKANVNFLALQDQLEGAENRISVERQRYSETVREYNTQIVVFPGNLIATVCSFASRAYFEEESAAAKAPQVKF